MNNALLLQKHIKIRFHFVKTIFRKQSSLNFLNILELFVTDIIALNKEMSAILL